MSFRNPLAFLNAASYCFTQDWSYAPTAGLNLANAFGVKTSAS